MASPTNPVNPTRANPTDANLKPYSKYVIQCADFIFWRKPQLKIKSSEFIAPFTAIPLASLESPQASI